MSFMQIESHPGGLQFHAIWTKLSTVCTGLTVKADGPLDMGFTPFGRPNGRRHVANIIQGVEDAEDTHAVFNRQADELFHHVVGVMAVADQILSAQKHLQRGLGHVRLERAQAFPGVFVEETDTGVKSRTPPGLQRKKPDPVHFPAEIGRMSAVRKRVAIKD